MITHYFKTVQDSELKELATPRTGVWTHVTAPSEEEIGQLLQDYNLDEAVLEDAQDFFEVPRFERSGGVNYFFTRYPYDAGQAAEGTTAPLLIAVGESFVLTVALREVPQLSGLLDKPETVVTTQKTKLFITMLERLTTSFDRELTRLRRAVHRDRVKLRRIGPREIQRLVNYENELNDIIAAVVPTNAWLDQVMKGNYIQLFNEDVEMMEDLTIANKQLIDSSRQLLVTIQNVRNASEAIMTSSLNTTIKTLTLLTILLTIPTIVASLYGMNVELPGQAVSGMFWLIVSLILVVVGIALYLFKRNNWL